MQTKQELNNKLRTVLHNLVIGIFQTGSITPPSGGVIWCSQIQQTRSRPVDHSNLCLMTIKLRVYNSGVFRLEHHDSILLA
jgi:hypothetical protein